MPTTRFTHFFTRRVRIVLASCAGLLLLFGLAGALALLGDFITTDHISPAGSFKADSPAGRYLLDHGVAVRDFNSYGSRRGNHEVMMRGTFANIRIRNEMVPGVEGGMTRHLPGTEVVTIYDAAVRYQQEGTPLAVVEQDVDVLSSGEVQALAGGQAQQQAHGNGAGR